MAEEREKTENGGDKSKEQRSYQGIEIEKMNRAEGGGK